MTYSFKQDENSSADDGSKADRVNVFLCISSNYWPHAAVVLHSLSRYSSNVDVWVYYETWNERWQRKIQNLLVRSGSTATFVPFDFAMLRGLKECGHLGLSTYYRLFVPDLLPEHLKRIVYLDADLIVRRSISELYDQPLDDAVIGAVSGPASECYVRDAERLGLPSGSGYFNAGVLVINLSRWRQLGIRDQSLQFLRDHPDKVIYADQDLLNATLYRLYKALPPMWNVTLELFRSLPSIQNAGSSQIELDQLVAEPAIVHFNGQHKPWHLRYRHPFKSEYLALRRQLQLRPYVSDDLCSMPLMRLRKGLTQLIKRLGNR